MTIHGGPDAEEQWFVLAGRRPSSSPACPRAACSSRASRTRRPAKHVYELRTYTAPDGKLGELNSRFRDHTIRIFNKHGMKSVIYLAPQDAPDSQNTLIYVLEHPSREAAKKAWADFQADPEWVKVVRRIAGQRPHRQQGGVGVRRSDRLLADEITVAMDVDPLETATGADEDNTASHDRDRIRLNTRVAVTVALLATFLGVCKVKDDNIVQAMQQAQADKLDHWNFYQARNIRQEVAERGRAQLQLAAAGAPAAQQAELPARRSRRYEALVADQATKKEEAAPSGGAGSEDVRCAELPRRSVRSVGRADRAGDFAAGADGADPQALALLAGDHRHDRRRLVGSGRIARLASPPRRARAPVVLGGRHDTSCGISLASVCCWSAPATRSRTRRSSPGSRRRWTARS